MEPSGRNRWQPMVEESYPFNPQTTEAVTTAARHLDAATDRLTKATADLTEAHESLDTQRRGEAQRKRMPPGP